MFFSFFAECHTQVESQCVRYAAGVNDVESVNPVVPIPTVENTGTYVKGGIDKHVICYCNQYHAQGHGVSDNLD